MGGLYRVGRDCRPGNAVSEGQHPLSDERASGAATRGPPAPLPGEGPPARAYEWRVARAGRAPRATFPLPNFFPGARRGGAQRTASFLGVPGDKGIGGKELAARIATPTGCRKPDGKPSQTRVAEWPNTDRAGGVPRAGAWGACWGRKALAPHDLAGCLPRLVRIRRIVFDVRLSVGADGTPGRGWGRTANGAPRGGDSRASGPATAGSPTPRYPALDHRRGATAAVGAWAGSRRAVVTSGILSGSDRGPPARPTMSGRRRALLKVHKTARTVLCTSDGRRICRKRVQYLGAAPDPCRWSPIRNTPAKSGGSVRLGPVGLARPGETATGRRNTAAKFGSRVPALGPAAQRSGRGGGSRSGRW